MTETKEVLQLVATMDTMKVLMALLALLLLVVLVYLRNQSLVQRGLNERLAAREKTDNDIRKLQEEAEQRLADTQARRENAQIGILSQLAAQNETLLTVHQQTIAVLEQSTLRDEARAKGIAERNKIQAETNAALKEQTEAVRAIAPAVVDGLKPVAEAFRSEVMHDAQAWVDGLKSEARGPLATIEGIPQRLDTHEKRLEAMVERIPAAVAAALATDLRNVSDHLLKLSERVERSILPPVREIALATPGEAPPLNERRAAEVNP